MAVYEQGYRPYSGPLTAAWSRFLVLPRHAYEQVMRSRAFMAFLVLCAVPPLAGSVMIYLHHNLYAIQALKLDPQFLEQALPIDGRFFWVLLTTQSVLASLIAIFMGAAVVTPDFANNGLALYLVRPFTRWEYVLGRFSVLAILMSLITWSPMLVLFFFQSYLGGWAWFSTHLNILAGLFLGSWLWIALVSLLTLTAAAVVRRRPLVVAAVIGAFFVSRAMGLAVNLIYDTWLGGFMNLLGLTRTVWASFFGVEAPTQVPAVAAMIALAGYCLLCLWILSRRVRAYQVVR